MRVRCFGHDGSWRLCPDAWRLRPPAASARERHSAVSARLGAVSSKSGLDTTRFGLGLFEFCGHLVGEAVLNLVDPTKLGPCVGQRWPELGRARAIPTELGPSRPNLSRFGPGRISGPKQLLGTFGATSELLGLAGGEAPGPTFLQTLRQPVLGSCSPRGGVCGATLVRFSSLGHLVACRLAVWRRLGQAPAVCHSSRRAPPTR